METPTPFEGQMRMPEDENRLRLPDTAEKISSELGFSETPEMTALRGKMVGMSTENQEFFDIYGEYQEAAQAQADVTPGPEGRLALMILNAQIKETVGATEAAFEDYMDAIEMADNYNMTKTMLEIGILKKRLDLLSADWPADVPRH